MQVTRNKAPENRGLCLLCEGPFQFSLIAVGRQTDAHEVAESLLRLYVNLFVPILHGLQRSMEALTPSRTSSILIFGRTLVDGPADVPAVNALQDHPGNGHHPGVTNHSQD